MYLIMLDILRVQCVCVSIEQCSDFVTSKIIPDFPGWFYCLGLRSKAGRFIR